LVKNIKTSHQSAADRFSIKDSSGFHDTSRCTSDPAIAAEHLAAHRSAGIMAQPTDLEAIVFEKKSLVDLAFQHLETIQQHLGRIQSPDKKLETYLTDYRASLPPPFN